MCSRRTVGLRDNRPVINEVPVHGQFCDLYACGYEMASMVIMQS